MSNDVKNVYKEIGMGECAWIDVLHTDGLVEITGNGISEAEENIREWLTRINDICRIASFFHAGEAKAPRFRQGESSHMFLQLEAMFADENLPEVKVAAPHFHTSLCVVALLY